MTIIVLALGLALFVVFEWLAVTQMHSRLVSLEHARRLSRELSLYVQYNAHDTSAYTLGRLEHRREFEEHARQFAALRQELEGVLGGVDMEEDERDQLHVLAELRARYDAAAQDLFAAADAQRSSPSPAAAMRQAAAWEATDALGDELDAGSQQLASQLGEDADLVLAALDAREAQFLPVVAVAGGSITLLMGAILLTTVRAVMEPLQRLTRIVKRATAGDLEQMAEVSGTSEIGVLGSAYNELVATIRAQIASLQAQEVRLREQNASQAELLATVQALETPIIPLADGVLVAPVVGAVDEQRGESLASAMLEAVHAARARFVIVDLTGLSYVDAAVTAWLERLTQAIQLLGAQVVLTGISGEAAAAIVSKGLNMGGVRTLGQLRDGVALVLGSVQERRAAA